MVCIFYQEKKTRDEQLAFTPEHKNQKYPTGCLRFLNAPNFG